ncbi:hypothetical protein TKK_0011494 [Trichogramma kaykai]|uniref:PAN2-PAN3 deadenylation complex catalytic subunit PAN2 N-terminal domain-containing protein n=1 Tax=Trichogramma kaykai TaxID=54128 RepID=A0ABD2WR05_9HYME
MMTNNHQPFAQQFDKCREILFTETRLALNSTFDCVPVTNLKYDRYEELLWTGNEEGYCNSYYGPEFQRYTAFRVTDKSGIRQIESLENGILILTQNSLRCQLRRGVPVFTHTSNNTIDLQTFVHYSPTNILMAGRQNMIDFDLTTKRERSVSPVIDGGCELLKKHSKLICASSGHGEIHFFDPSTMIHVNAVKPHTTAISDFDIWENTLVTCGFSNGRQGISGDQFLMVYDLRQMKVLQPVQTLFIPKLIKFLPNKMSMPRAVIASSFGEMQVLDTVFVDSVNPTGPLTHVYQVQSDGAAITSMDISSTGECMCLGDSAGALHVMTTNLSGSLINEYSKQTEFADPLEVLPPISFNDQCTPLSIIPMPYCENKLLSSWPEELSKKKFRKTPIINPEILKNMQMQGSIGYAPNPNPPRRRRT